MRQYVSLLSRSKSAKECSLPADAVAIFVANVNTSSVTGLDLISHAYVGPQATITEDERESRDLSALWGFRMDSLTGKERRIKPERGGQQRGPRCPSVSPFDMDQEYERRLLRQINLQNLPAEARLTRSGNVTCSPISVKSGDRFIPTRAGSNWSINFHHANENCRSPSQNHKAKDASSDSGKDTVAYAALLRNELLGAGIESVSELHVDERRHAVYSHGSRGLFRYTVHTKSVPFDSDNEVSPYSLSPLTNKSHKLLRSPRKPARKISKIPFKVLDAPELQDDFYLNLVDWSAGNLLSVGLGACVYLWSACTSQVTRLCDLSVDGDSVTSVCWNERGSLVAVGTHKGYVQIWDAAGGRKLTSLEGHSARVGALAWNGEQLSSGSRDRVILQRDIRTPPSAERRLQGHRQEVCGLKWSPDHQHLASGGNDNKLLVWNSSSLLPVQQYSDHLAAVKAIAWSPHQHGLLASGGGTADRCLRFWNTLTGQALQSTDTGLQVCNLAWSKHANELVSTHGYSQNQILVWKYPSLTQVAKLTGHSYRVLYLAVSPDGEAIVTGAGDETLRFWNIFSKTRCTKESKSVLNLFTRIR
ncbi:fizzy-related protein homolog isoform X2 [Vanacampus margaritifer]